MSVIYAYCDDQVLEITEAPVIAAGGLSEVDIVFSFSKEWDGFLKTAVFYRDEENTYYGVLDGQNSCVVPWEVCDKVGTFYIGVFGEMGETRRTSTVVRYKVKRGTITEDTKPSDPTPELYDQVIAKVGEAVCLTPQTLTDEQKAQARENIGASSEASVKIENGVLVVEGGGSGGASADLPIVVAKFASTEENVANITCKTHTADEIKDYLTKGTPVLAWVDDQYVPRLITCTCWVEGDGVSVGDPFDCYGWMHIPNSEDHYVDGNHENKTIGNELWIQYN